MGLRSCRVSVKSIIHHSRHSFCRLDDSENRQPDWEGNRAKIKISHAQGRKTDDEQQRKNKPFTKCSDAPLVLVVRMLFAWVLPVRSVGVGRCNGVECVSLAATPLSCACVSCLLKSRGLVLLALWLAGLFVAGW